MLSFDISQHRPEILAFTDKISQKYLNSQNLQLIVDNLTNLDSCKAINSQIEDKGRFPLHPQKYNPMKKKKQQELENYLTLQKQAIAHSLTSTMEECIKKTPNLNPDKLNHHFEVIEQIFEIFLKDINQFSPKTFSFIFQYGWESVTNTQSNDYIMPIGIGGNQIPPPYIEAYIIQGLEILKYLNQLKQANKIHFLPFLVLCFSYPTQVIECDLDNHGNAIRPTLHYHTAQVNITRLHQFISIFAPEIKNNVIFCAFPAYKRYSLGRVFFAVLYQRIKPEISQKLFTIKGDVVNEEKEQTDLIYGILEHYNAYVTRHLFSAFIFSHSHSLRLGSAYTESQFWAFSSTLLTDLRYYSEEIALKILVTASSLLDTLFSQDPNCNDWSESDLNLTDFEQIQANLAYQLSEIPKISTIHAQIGIPCHASYLKHPLEMTLQNLVNIGCYKAEILVKQGRADKARKLEQSFESVTKVIGLDNYIAFLSQWVDQYRDYDVDESVLLLDLFEQHERIQSILLNETSTRKLLNYHL